MHTNYIYVTVTHVDFVTEKEQKSKLLSEEIQAIILKVNAADTIAL